VSDHLILIPVFDEVGTIAEIVGRAKRHGAVLVVDDGSADASAAAAAGAGAEIVQLRRRCGKGAALQVGFAEALARGVERVVTLDGDGQHDPDDVPRLLAAAEAMPRALVVGRRLAHDPVLAADAQIPLDRLNAMRVAGFFINSLTEAPLLDTQSGFRVYPAALLRDLGPMRGGFVLETEVLVRAAARGFVLRDVAIQARPVSGRRSRFRPVSDGIAVGRYLAGQVARRLGCEVLALLRAAPAPFIGERRRARHRELAQSVSPYRGNPAELATAVAVFMLSRVSESTRAWWQSPDTRRLGLLAAGVAATPALLVLTLAHRPLRGLGLDPLTPLIARLYSQDRVAATLPRSASETSSGLTCPGHRHRSRPGASPRSGNVTGAP
jgi:Glycosyl transferase family 2